MRFFHRINMDSLPVVVQFSLRKENCTTTVNRNKEQGELPGAPGGSRGAGYWIVLHGNPAYRLVQFPLAPGADTLFAEVGRAQQDLAAWALARAIAEGTGVGTIAHLWPFSAHSITFLTKSLQEGRRVALPEAVV